MKAFGVRQASRLLFYRLILESSTYEIVNEPLLHLFDGGT